MSFSSNQSSLGQSVSNNTSGRVSTFKQAEPFPLYWGRARIAVKPITPVLHWTYRNTAQSSYAFATFLGAVAQGPADEIIQIHANGKPYNGIFLKREDVGGDYITHTLNRGTTPVETWRIWWGTETQANFSTLINSLTDVGNPIKGKRHPSYLGGTVVLIQDLDCGQATSGQTPPLPNLELELYRRSPRTYSFGHTPHGTHPIGALYDTLRDKRGGLGLGDQYFIEENWQAKIDKLYNTGVGGRSGTDLFISPTIIDVKKASDVVGEQLDYFDGLLRWKNGKVEVDFRSNDADSSSPAGLRELSWHDMVAEPEINPDGLDNIKTLVAVTGLDKDNNDNPLSESTETAQVPYALQLAGEPRVDEIDRKAYTTRQQIRDYANYMAAIKATPSLTGIIRVRRESATQLDGLTPLLPGDRFNLDYTPLSLDLVCRVTERLESDDKSEVQITFEKERGAAPQPYQPPLDPRAERDANPPDAFDRYLFAEIPPAAPTDPTRVVVLAERVNTSVTSFNVHFSPSNSWPGAIIGTFTTFAVGAILKTDLLVDTADATVEVETDAVDWPFIISQSASEQNDDKLLLITSQGEWFSVGAISVVSAGRYSLSLKRARQNSSATVHSVDDVVFFVYREQMPVIENLNFNGTIWFKLQPLNANGEGDVQSATSLALSNRDPLDPSGLVAVGKTEAVSLSWDANPRIGLTEIFERSAASPSPSDGDAPSYVTTVNSFLRSGLASGSTPYFWIRNIDNVTVGRTSGFAGPVSATALAAPAGPKGDKGDKGDAGTITKVSTPTFSFSPAKYVTSSATSTCTLTCATSGAQIWYTYNGDTKKYTTPFGVQKLKDITCWAEKSDMVPSDTGYDIYEDNT